MKFTKPTVARLSLPSAKSDHLEFDDDLPRFGIRLRGGGKRTWFVQYRVGAKQRRLSLGSAAAVDVDKARAAAKRELSKVGLGRDPQAERKKAHLDATVTLGGLVERYLAAKKPVLKPRSYVETERHLEQLWARLHNQPLSTISRLEVANRLLAISQENGPVAADRARSALSAFFTWVIKEGLFEDGRANPVLATNRPAEPKQRNRNLKEPELVEIWNACRADEYGAIVRLLMLTGQRREEVGAMGWSEIDADRSLWLIPAARTKNSRAHEVPLPDAVLEVIATVPRRDGRDLLFGGGEGPYSGWSSAKRALDERMAEARSERGRDALEPWVLHDLRHAVSTQMHELGVQPHVVEAVLNHVSGHRAGVAGTYNHAAYRKDKAAALALWAEHVRSLTSGRHAKVVPMTERARA